MEHKAFVGNLSWNVTQQQLEEFFSSCGTIERAQVITDRETGRSRGFGFVTFASDQDLQKAIEMNGCDWQGRNLTINKANDKPRGGSSGGRRG